MPPKDGSLGGLKLCTSDLLHVFSDVSESPDITAADADCPRKTTIEHPNSQCLWSDSEVVT